MSVKGLEFILGDVRRACVHRAQSQHDEGMNSGVLTNPKMGINYTGTCYTITQKPGQRGKYPDRKPRTTCEMHATPRRHATIRPRNVYIPGTAQRSAARSGMQHATQTQCILRSKDPTPRHVLVHVPIPIEPSPASPASPAQPVQPSPPRKLRTRSTLDPPHASTTKSKPQTATSPSPPALLLSFFFVWLVARAVSYVVRTDMRVGTNIHTHHTYTIYRHRYPRHPSPPLRPHNLPLPPSHRHFPPATHPKPQPIGNHLPTSIHPYAPHLGRQYIPSTNPQVRTHVRTRLARTRPRRPLSEGRARDGDETTAV